MTKYGITVNILQDRLQKDMAHRDYLRNEKRDAEKLLAENQEQIELYDKRIESMRASIEELKLSE